MIFYYVKLALSNLTRNRFGSTILFLGLQPRMTSCLLLLQYVSFQLSFERFQKDHTLIYHIVNEGKNE